MKKFQPTLEHALYALALLIAIGLRFINLGLLPLSEYEADWALQALRITEGMKPAIGPNPAYVHLTSILFAVFGATNFLARFWPALAGTVLVLTPWALRTRFGRPAALILAFGLALDPGLVAMSHLAGGPMLAVCAFVLAFLAWCDKRFALAGVFAGVALLAGPSIWLGLLGVGLAWVFAAALTNKFPPPENADDKPSIPPVNRENGRTALIWGVGVLLVLGSLLLLSPKGLPAFLDSMWVFLRGWVRLGTVPLWQPALALPAYEILPLGFGIAAAVRGIIKKDALSIGLGIWALLAFLLTLLYSSRQTGDLSWALLPLWMLAALELSKHLDFEGRNLWELAATMTVVIVFLVFGWLNTASIANMDLASTIARTRSWLLLAVFFLIILSLLLVWTAWSSAVARLGGVWGAVVFFGLFTLALSTGTSTLRRPLTTDLWVPEPRSGRVDILLKVANEISELNSGEPANLPLTILAVDSPALHWLFRDWTVQDATVLAADATPEILITPPGDVSLSVDYRGEPLVLTESPDWANATSGQWVSWIIHRQMPVLRERINLWVRSDLMLDTQGLPAIQP